MWSFRNPLAIASGFVYSKGSKKKKENAFQVSNFGNFFKRHLKLAAKVFSILLSWHKMSKQAFFLKFSMLPTIETTHGKFQCRIYFTKHTVTRD